MPVIFDIDKTIYKKTTVRQFLPAAFLNGTLPLRFFLSLPIYFLKIVVFDTHNSFLQKRIKPLRGLKESAMAATAREVFEKKIRFGLNEVIVERLKKAQKSGEHVIIAS